MEVCISEVICLYEMVSQEQSQVLSLGLFYFIVYVFNKDIKLYYVLMLIKMKVLLITIYCNVCSILYYLGVKNRFKIVIMFSFYFEINYLFIYFVVLGISEFYQMGIFRIFVGIFYLGNVGFTFRDLDSCIIFVSLEKFSVIVVDCVQFCWFFMKVICLKFFY